MSPARLIGWLRLSLKFSKNILLNTTIRTGMDKLRTNSLRAIMRNTQIHSRSTYNSPKTSLQSATKSSHPIQSATNNANLSAKRSPNYTTSSHTNARSPTSNTSSKVFTPVYQHSPKNSNQNKTSPSTRSSSSPSMALPLKNLSAFSNLLKSTIWGVAIFKLPRFLIFMVIGEMGSILVNLNKLVGLSKLSLNPKTTTTTPTSYKDSKTSWNSHQTKMALKKSKKNPKCNYWTCNKTSSNASPSASNFWPATSPKPSAGATRNVSTKRTKIPSNTISVWPRSSCSLMLVSTAWCSRRSRRRW